MQRATGTRRRSRRSCATGSASRGGSETATRSSSSSPRAIRCSCSASWDDVLSGRPQLPEDWTDRAAGVLDRRMLGSRSTSTRGASTRLERLDRLLAEFRRRRMHRSGGICAALARLSLARGDPREALRCAADGARGRRRDGHQPGVRQGGARRRIEAALELARHRAGRGAPVADRRVPAGRPAQFLDAQAMRFRAGLAALAQDPDAERFQAGLGPLPRARCSRSTSPSRSSSTRRADRRPSVTGRGERDLRAARAQPWLERAGALAGTSRGAVPVSS